MFCPNCGAPNADDATTCQKCGFNIKGTASPKFKGTMLMMNANPGGVPGAPNPGLTPPMPTAADAKKPSIPRPAAQPSSKLKGTMIGVAPPSLGATSPEPTPAPAGFGTPGQLSPTQVSPVSPDAGITPPAGVPASDMPVGAPSPSPAVPNDLGPPAGSPAPEFAAAAVMGAAGAAGGMPETQPRPTQPGDSPPAMAPAAQAGGEMGFPPGAGAPPGMVPMGGQPGPPLGAPGMVAAGAMGGAGFTQRSPFMIFLLTMVTCGIYALFWYKATGEEMEAKGAEIGPWWHLLVPILGLIWVYKWCQGLEHVSRGQVSTNKSLILLILLGPIGMAMLQNNINEL